MVCKECGAYNAEHLTHCRVCAAKLTQENEEGMNDDNKPSKKFAVAPQWPGKAYEGAEKAGNITEEDLKRKVKSEVEEESEKISDSVFDKPISGEGNNMPKFCMKCGKALVAGAAFCPFCGAKVDANDTVAAADEETKAFEMPRAKASYTASAASSKDDSYKAAKYTKDAEEETDEIADDYKPAKSSGKDLQVTDDKDLIDEDDEYYDDEDEEDLDDEYYDSEFDDDDEEALPTKKKSPIVLIILIAVLVALIAFFAFKIFGKGILGSSSSTESPIEEASMSLDEVTATIEDDEVDGVEMFLITVQAPNDSLVQIVSKAQLEEDTVTVTKDNQVSIRVPRVVFLPGNYCDSTEVTVTPQIKVVLPDGQEKEVNLPECSVTVPVVSLVITEPTTKEVEAPADHSKITIAGNVTDHLCKVTVNDEEVEVYEGGEFTYYYSCPDDDEAHDVVIVASKENYVSATETIHVTPFVIRDLTVSFASNPFTASDGKATITGSVPAKSVITASCDDKNVTLGECTVTDTTFTCDVTVKEEGVFKVNFEVACDGYNTGTFSCLVECPTEVKASTYKTKALNINKDANYQKAAQGKASNSKLIFTGTIKEIVSTSPYTIFTVVDSSGHKVYAVNRSSKMQITTSKIGNKCTVGGFNMGIYTNDTATSTAATDTTAETTDETTETTETTTESNCPYVWAWYIWNS